MENRYKLLKNGVGKLSDYNEIIEEMGGEITGYRRDSR